MIFVGIDPSLAGTGIAVLDVDPRTLRGRVVAHEIPTTNQARGEDWDAVIADGDRRAEEIRTELLACLAPFDSPSFIYMERPAVIRSAKTSLQLVGLAAVLRNTLLREGYPCQTVAGATLQAHAGVKRKPGHRSRDGKTQVIAAANARWRLGLSSKDDNRADAVMLADLAVHDYRSHVGWT